MSEVSKLFETVDSLNQDDARAIMDYVLLRVRARLPHDISEEVRTREMYNILVATAVEIAAYAYHNLDDVADSYRKALYTVSDFLFGDEDEEEEDEDGSSEEQGQS